AAAAIVRDPDLYQRGGLLVHVIRDTGDEIEWLVREAGTPRIAMVPTANIRERLTRVARFFATKETGNGTVEQPRHVPDWCVAAVASRGSWPGVRPIQAVTEVPVLRPD